MSASVPTAHSYTSLKQFEQCPLRYYRQRVLKDVTDKGNSASYAGDRSHAALEQRLGKNVELPLELRQSEPICSTLERLASGGSLFVEAERCFTAEFNPCGWWDKNVYMRVKSDVEIVNSDVGMLVDWKTGKRYPDFLQMEIAAAATFVYNPHVRIVRAMFVWLKDSTQDMEVYDRAQLPHLLSGIVNRVRRIERAAADNNWPARPSGLCNYCPAKPTCPHA